MVINWVLPNLKKWRNYDDLRLHIHIIVCTHSKWRNWESSSGESAFRNWFINTTALHGGRIFLYLKELARVLIPCRGMNVEQEWGKREKKKKNKQGAAMEKRDFNRWVYNVQHDRSWGRELRRSDKIWKQESVWRLSYPQWVGPGARLQEEQYGKVSVVLETWQYSGET